MSEWYYNITFSQSLAFLFLLTYVWSLLVAISHVRNPSKETLQRIFYIQLCGSFFYGFFRGLLYDPKDFVFILAPLVWVPIVLAAAWVMVKALNVASTVFRFVYSRYDDMPDYQVSQDSAGMAMNPQIVRFVDSSGNTRYRVKDKDFPTLYSAESYLYRLNSDTK